jgi:beta-hydroxyacyl-ACP dehydratase FabZ
MEQKLNTTNQEAMTYTTEEIAYTILGGIRLEGLDRLRVTIKIEVLNRKFQHYLNNPDIAALAIRQNLDLYSITQVEKLARLIADRLEVGVTAVSKDLSDITNELERYRLQQIEKTLPHRYPFLLVDKIIELTDKHIVGIKNVTYNEPFFTGHFPGNPVMPGVLQVEALAQTGGILCINSLPPGEYDTYFLKIDNCKFKQKVIPGVTMILKMELISPIRRGICEMRGTVYVGNKIATEADLMAQVIKR